MPRQVYVYRDGKLVPKAEAAPLPIEGGPAAGYYVIPDIQPYKSQLTGEMVTSRSRHRALLRQHGCIEVGNEWSGDKFPKVPPVNVPGGLRDDLRRAYSDWRAKRRR